MLVFIFTAKLRPIIIGSLSGWLMLAGMTARPAAISARTNSGVMCVLMPSSSQFMFSRMATYSISGVMMPALAQAICVVPWPDVRRLSIHGWRMRSIPFLRSVFTSGSENGPLVS